MEIGSILKEAREERNMTLDDIQEKTKIQKRYLAAIENDHFDTLPGRFYARAFIKEYAEVVGLDVDEVLAYFDDNVIHEEEKEVVQASRLRRMKKRNSGGTSRILSLLPTFIVVLLIIAIIFVAWTLIKQTLIDNSDNSPGESDHIIRNSDENKSNNESSNNNTNDEEDTEEEEEEIEEVEPTFDVVTAGEGNNSLSELTFTHPGEQVEITLEADGNTWIDLYGEEEVDIDTFDRTEYYVGENGSGVTLSDESDKQTIDVTGEEFIYINIGYLPNLTISINDVQLDYPSDAQQQKIRIELIPAD